MRTAQESAKNPIVSIIIPSYNSLDALRHCVLSIQEQLFKNYEVIIIDGNSTDGTLMFLKTLLAPFRWISESDTGIYDAMNKGVSLAHGQWFYFMGADDLFYENNTLQTIFKNSLSDDITLLIGKVKYDYTTKDSILIKQNEGVFKPIWSKRLWFKNTVHHQGVFYRRRLFKSHSYNLDYKVLADYDFNLALFKQHQHVNYLKEIIAITGTSGVSKNYQWSLYQEEIKLKVSHTSSVLIPLFYMLGISKYLLKKVL